MKQIFLLLFFLSAGLGLQAGEPWLKRPLRFVPADSVVTWNYDGRDFREMALQADSTVRPSLRGVTRETWKQRKRLRKAWLADAPQRNVVGGRGNARREPQALSALADLTRGAQLFLMQGHAATADHYERALYNAALHTLADTSERQGTWEKMAAAQMLAELPGLMYATGGEAELYVNLYTNAVATVHAGGARFQIDQITEMPLAGSVRLRLMALKEPVRLRFHLRMPDWTGLRPDTEFAFSGGERQVPTVYVNGHELEDGTPDERGYVVIDRTWRSMDEIYIDFPLRAQFVRRRADLPADEAAPVRDEAVWQWGPLVYYAQAPTRGCYFPTAAPPIAGSKFDEAGFPLLTGTMYRYEGTPADAAAPAVTYTAASYAATANSESGE